MIKEVFNEIDLENLKSNICIGHRYRTAGDFLDSTVQPLIECQETRISLSHNGNITNLDYIENIRGKKKI